MLGLLEGEPLSLRIEEVHRFKHVPLEAPGGPVWDLTGIANEVLLGVKLGAEAARAAGVELKSVGVDTWGVDYGVVNQHGELIGLPHCYRDPANTAARGEVLGELKGGAESLYRRTGIQPLPFNTLFQLWARVQKGSEMMPTSGRVQLMPDLLHFWLSGTHSNERTNASTGALLEASTADWDRANLQQLGIPQDWFGSLCAPGTRLGKLRPELTAGLGVSPEIEVVAPATHDTASAVAAVPATGREPGTWAYLSSGTWSLLGVELAEPIATAEAFQAGFTNELGVDCQGKPTVRFLRNIGGLWLIQELQRDLALQGSEHSFSDLAALAVKAEPFRTQIDPNAEDLAAPGQIVAKLRGHAERTGQPLPTSPGELARCCLESLALCYAETLDRLEQITGRKIEVLHAVGGGIQNDFLNCLTAAAIGRPLFTGPVEATAIGNVLVQAMGLGLIEDLAELRHLVARSLPPQQVDASEVPSDWTSARERYTTIAGQSA
ncbi:Rhamnulokinase [Planctomycetes bacterium MalM25]|nr:Rhamnulokinase [Planctomycetes bacterium MalM25]